MSSDHLHMNDILTDLADSLPFKSIFALQEIERLTPALLDQLGEQERRELESFQHEKRRREYASSRRLLRQLAGEWGVTGEGFLVCKNELGNPFAETSSTRFEVSIAHTDRVVFGGLSSSEPIGIDVEPLNRKVSDRVRSRMMHPVERQNGLDIPTIRLWTVKEAYIKLRGQGLRLNMNEVCVQRKGEDFVVAPDRDKTAKICSFAYRGHWLAVAFYL
ncbi:4'-phosphopantetheinyl transferase family protein [Fodinibius roseus]|uniref:4'-phosphopantetheinyl transferase family protein n=1 Tax=Fodinibius roseus TaxID=1194090 RepID=UPI001114853D|nr:4'-phosphopantetheinyl transferase superfamily protein [Fodinibius roseus]